MTGAGAAACFDVDGRRKWIAYVEKPHNKGWGHAASPILSEDKLLLHYDHLIALDAETGKEQWRQAVQGLYGTLLVKEFQGRPVAITPTGVFVDVRTGRIISNASDTFYMRWGNPIVEGDMLYAVDQKMETAVRLPERLTQDFKPEVVWKNEKTFKRDCYGAAVLRNDLLFVPSGRGRWMKVINRKTGEVLYQKRLSYRGNNHYANTTVCGDKLFVTSEGGETIVLVAGPEYQEIGRNLLPPYRSTPVFEDNRIYIRSRDHLYCIGAPQ
jgi:outer membrane protein assembly factor BamB